MKVQKVEISGYRSLVDVGLSLEQGITTLVGPNESGKSNLLTALTMLHRQKPIPEGDHTYLVESEPKITYHITDLEVPHNPVAEAIPGGSPGPARGRVSDHSEVSLIYEKNTDGHKIIGVDEGKPHLQNILEKTTNGIDSIISEYESQGASQVWQKIAEVWREESSTSIREVIENSNLDGISGRQEQAALRNLKRIPTSPPELVSYSAPSTVYFNHEVVLPDSSDLDGLDKGDPYYELLRISGISIDEFRSLSAMEQKQLREAIAEELTDRFNRYWRQEEVKFHIEPMENGLGLLIANTDAGESDTFDPPSYRSEGFRYFLSLFIRLLANADDDLEGNLILLDDPGVHLHPDAQKDLRKALEDLAEDNQIVMATHSPFLINGNDTSEIRLVDRQGQTPGTRVVHKMSEHESRGDDAFASVRAVIGAGFADSLFANKKNILVEGMTDEKLLKSFSRYFGSNGGPSFDEDEVAFIDSHGASKMHKYATIMEAEGYDYVCLFDSDSEGDDRRKDLVDDKGIPRERTHQIHESLPDLEEYGAKVEDVCSVRTYYEAFTKVHDDVPDVEEISQPGSRSTTTYLGDEYGAQINGINKVKTTDTIVEWVESDDDRISVETCERFAELIRDLHDRLNGSVEPE